MPRRRRAPRRARSAWSARYVQDPPKNGVKPPKIGCSPTQGGLSPFPTGLAVLWGSPKLAPRGDPPGLCSPCNAESFWGPRWILGGCGWSLRVWGPPGITPLPIFWSLFPFFGPQQRREKIERRQQEVESELKLWDPHNDPNAQGDAFKTLFVARVNYDTTESKLRREFEVYGPIKRLYQVYNHFSVTPQTSL
uniref:Uncharacterized protein n=1 Tax=Cyanoderma ruficeps TaxID=181631 RepID=A0A8C3QIU2_9PASS